MDNFAEFSKGLQQAKETAVRQFVEFHKTVAQAAYNLISAHSETVGIAYGSPVWTGRFAGSHTISIGHIDTSVLPPHPETGAGGIRWPEEPASPYRSKPASYASNKLAALKPFEVVYIANSLPYAQRLEGGYSLRAPEGVYNVAADAVRARYKNVQLRLK